MARSKGTKDNFPLVPDQLDAFNHSGFVKNLQEHTFDKPDYRKSDSRYRNDFARQVYYLAKSGYRNKDLGEFFGVNEELVVDWEKRYPDFGEALRQGRTVFNVKITETLSQRALGYDYIEKEESEHMDRYGKVTMLTSTKYKHMPPSVEAIVFWLTNRQRELWKNTQRVETDTKLQFEEIKKIDLSKLSEEEKNVVKSISIKKLIGLHGVSNN